MDITRQEAENALLHVEEDNILWHRAHEDADVNIYEMINFLVLKGKDPPLPLKPLTFRESLFGRKKQISSKSKNCLEKI